MPDKDDEKPQEERKHILDRECWCNPEVIQVDPK